MNPRSLLLKLLLVIAGILLFTLYAGPWNEAGSSGPHRGPPSVWYSGWSFAISGSRSPVSVMDAAVHPERSGHRPSVPGLP